MDSAAALKGLHRVKMNGQVYYYTWRGGPRITAIFGTEEFATAFKRHRTVASTDRTEGRHRESVKLYVTKDLCRGAGRRAKARGVEFSLTPDHLLDILGRQDYRCAVTRLRFSLTRLGERREVFRMPFRPSIDRIDPKAGYVPGNVRLVCFATNVALNDWGEDVFRALAEGYIHAQNRFTDAR